MFLAYASDAALPLTSTVSDISSRLSDEVEIFVLISALSFIPLFLIATTTFTRNIVVLGFMRSALGLQQSPPNIVLITLAMFLAIFTMEPIFNKSYDLGIKPYMENNVPLEEAAEKSWEPLHQFLVSQTKESDIALMYRISKKEAPSNVAEVPPLMIIPAFMLSELRLAFKIGFIIYLPFLLLDFVVSAILMSLGMIMVPPITISLPLKIMLFVVVDGWSLLIETLARSVVG